MIKLQILISLIKLQINYTSLLFSLRLKCEDGRYTLSTDFCYPVQNILLALPWLVSVQGRHFQAHLRKQRVRDIGNVAVVTEMLVAVMTSWI